MTRSRLLTLALLLILLAGGRAVAYESMYPATEPGRVELKTLPARTALVTSSTGSMFAERNRNFSRLFDYISKHDVKMTVPVEADTTTNTMRFFAGRDVAGRSLPSEATVSVETLTTLTVVSAGLRGSYTRERYDEGVRRVQAWLAENPGYAALGEPYVVYWNSPFMPAPFRRSEVHQPVERK